MSEHKRIGRPSGPPTTRVFLLLTPEQVEWLDEKAAANGLSRSEVARRVFGVAMTGEATEAAQGPNQ